MTARALLAHQALSRARYNVNLETVTAVINHASEEIGRVTDKADDFRVLRSDSIMFVDVDRDEREALAMLRRFCAINMDFGFRVYRTRAGLRYLCTSAEFDATSDQARRVMQELGADEKYVRHVAAQRCFSARVTPKPERCHSFPSAFATCEFVWHEGNQAINPKCVTLAKLHDSIAEAHSGKELA